MALLKATFVVVVVDFVVVVVDIVVVVVVFVINAVGMTQLVFTDHIISSCGQNLNLRLLKAVDFVVFVALVVVTAHIILDYGQ